MGKIITFVLEKGGTGKSSDLLNCAIDLSRNGRKVLIIDMDGQRANITDYLGVKKTDSMLTMLNVLQGGASIRDAIVPLRENLYIVPANSQVTGIGDAIKFSWMKKAVFEVRDEYDYILIDVTPTPNRIHALSMGVSDYLILVMLPDGAGLTAIMGISESIDEIREFANPGLKVLGILVNQSTSRTNMSKQSKLVSGKLAGQLGTSLFNTGIRSSVLVQEAEYQHLGVEEYDPKSKVAEDFRNLVAEIEERIGADNE